ncbi:hypothetical protein CC79DRAFT_1335262 [Sarocladium strictum]
MICPCNPQGLLGSNAVLESSAVTTISALNDVPDNVAESTGSEGNMMSLDPVLNSETTIAIVTTVAVGPVANTDTTNSGTNSMTIDPIGIIETTSSVVVTLTQDPPVLSETTTSAEETTNAEETTIAEETTEIEETSTTEPESTTETTTEAATTTTTEARPEITCPSDPQQCADTILVRCDIYTGGLFQVASGATLTECFEICDDDPTCAIFTWNTGGGCYTSSNPNQSSGQVSGWASGTKGTC